VSNYADGRAAHLMSGGNIRYDAGGTAHVIPNTPEETTRTRRIGTTTEKAQRLERELVRAQLLDLSGQFLSLRHELRDLLTVVQDYRNLPQKNDDEFHYRTHLADFVIAQVEEMLK